MKCDSSVTAPGVTLPPTSCSRSVIRVSLFVYRLLNIDLFRERSRTGRVVTACRGGY